MMNELHGNYDSNLWKKLDPGTNDYSLEREKTEMNILQDKKDSSFIGGTVTELNLQSPLNSSAIKTAMDLTLHMHRNDSTTIFEDADYFSRTFPYKLMPITFETVNETIIHMEHNYCNFGSSACENINKTIHGEAEDRNYKKRKSKSTCGGFSGSDYVKDENESVAVSVNLREGFATNPKLDEDYSLPIQPLDLSLPVFHEQKTDKMLKENQSNIPKTKSESRSTTDLIQFNMCESNKENVTSSVRKIEVTISRPDQKEYYQPCQVFLNDVARISPDLIKNDCYEIDIIDRTGQDLEKEKYRMYYIVSESTWQRFESSAERIILTNDLNIGEPIRNNENLNKPKYLIFDRYSLTESLAQMCDKKGGSFEYTCIEESVPKIQETRREVQDCGNGFAVSRITVEGESWKSCDEGNADTGLGHLTETNILKRLLLCERPNIKTEPDSTIVSESERTLEKLEVTRLEAEEKVCDNACPVSMGTDAEKSKFTWIQTEPQVPIELIRDHVMEGSDERNQKLEIGKTGTGKSDLTSGVKCIFNGKEGKDHAAMKGELDKEIVGSRKKEIVSGFSVGIRKRNRNSKETVTLDIVDIAMKKKRKLNDVTGRKKKFGNLQFVVNPSSKRVTRLSAPPMKEEPQVTNFGNNKIRKGKKKINVDLSRSGNEVVETRRREKKIKTKKKGEASAPRGATTEGKLNRRAKDFPAVNTGGRKQLSGVMMRLREEESSFEKRETRSTTKRKAVENVRNTRTRMQEIDKLGGSSKNLGKSCTRRR